MYWLIGRLLTTDLLFGEPNVKDKRQKKKKKKKRRQQI
jgi:hypothetical protein